MQLAGLEPLGQAQPHRRRGEGPAGVEHRRPQLRRVKVVQPVPPRDRLPVGFRRPAGRVVSVRRWLGRLQLRPGRADAVGVEAPQRHRLGEAQPDPRRSGGRHRLGRARVAVAPGLEAVVGAVGKTFRVVGVVADRHPRLAGHVGVTLLEEVQPADLARERLGGRVGVVRQADRRRPHVRREHPPDERVVTGLPRRHLAAVEPLGLDPLRVLARVAQPADPRFQHAQPAVARHEHAAHADRPLERQHDVPLTEFTVVAEGQLTVMRRALLCPDHVLPRRVRGRLGRRGFAVVPLHVPRPVPVVRVDGRAEHPRLRPPLIYHLPVDRYASQHHRDRKKHMENVEPDTDHEAPLSVIERL